MFGHHLGLVTLLGLVSCVVPPVAAVPVPLQPDAEHTAAVGTGDETVVQTVVELGGSGVTVALEDSMAAQACIGLMNRHTPRVYGLFEGRDQEILTSVLGAASLPPPISAHDIIMQCLHSSQATAAGIIVYNYTTQLELMPNIITLAAVLNAVPLQLSHPAATNATAVFDATRTFAGMSSRDVTAYMYDHYANSTTSLAVVNPGLDVHDHKIHPHMTGSPDPKLFDYIVKARLFTMFLNDACIPFTDDHKLMERMVKEDGLDPWPRPIPVYGYNDAWPLAGDLFEAETNCVKEHNLGQIATSGVPNLSFLSGRDPITQPLVQNANTGPNEYNSTSSYVSVVVGDGDNMAMMRGSRYDWMKERVTRCTGAAAAAARAAAAGGDGSDGGCQKLLWTISPAAIRLFPDLVRWFYRQSFVTGLDYFVLPPSGDLYAYPAEMDSKSQTNFIDNTEQDCVVLNTSASVTWEWAGTWEGAIQHYYPRYAEHNIVNALFTVNVPFNLPALPWGFTEQYKILGGKVVAFRPREWRGNQSTSVPFSKSNYLQPHDMAAEVNNHPRGTVSYIYVTSDGGANLQLIHEMFEALDDHVQVVNHHTLAQMALHHSSSTTTTSTTTSSSTTTTTTTAPPPNPLQ